MNRNYHALAGGSVGQSEAKYSGTQLRFWALKAALLAVLVLMAAGMAFHFAGSAPVTTTSAGSTSAGLPSAGLSPVVALASDRQSAHPISASSLSFPLFFEPNVGQTDGRVKFLARGAGYGLFLTGDEAVLSLQRPAAKGLREKSEVVRMRLEGARSSARIQGAAPLPGKSNYFIGNDPAKWHSGVPQFARVEYRRVYPGIDLVYYGNQQQLEYDFRVAPGADPNQITLSFKGASARLESGDLVLATTDGDIRFHTPRIYQPSAGAPSKNPVITGGFRQLAGNKIGFTVGPYDHSRELVIDPVLTYSTYLGLGGESLASIAIDAAQNIYLACSTTSAGFPVTAGAYQGNLNGTQNILIAVLNPLAGSGSAQLLFATYLGGSGMDSLAGMAVDPGQFSFPSGGAGSIDVYVAGTTTSGDFPTANAFEGATTGTHGFVSAINIAPNSSSVHTGTLKYSTYLAGNGVDTVTGVAVDSFFDAYVTGTTTSTNVLTGFPSTPNGYQICPWQLAQSGGVPCPITSGPTQFFASEINTAGSGPQSMLYSTYFGGGYQVGVDSTGGGIAVDNISNNPRSNVNMYFTGTTSMPGGRGPNGEYGFPLINAWQSCLNESGLTTCTGGPGTNTDAFVVKINPNRTNAVPTYSTYLGGAGDDRATAVAADALGNSYVTGSTTSGDWNCANSCIFAPSPYGSSSGGQDAYIAKVTDEQGGLFPLVFFAYIGGSGDDTGNAIQVDSVQSAHIAGTTTSGDLHVVNATQSTYGGGASDAFVALMSTTPLTGGGPTGNYVTYLGGSSLDQGTGIAVDVNGTAYVAGVT
ncbi:MAG: SBBP repeat-containing protein, partial [Terriglobales bacterium]